MALTREEANEELIKREDARRAEAAKLKPKPKPKTEK